MYLVGLTSSPAFRCVSRVTFALTRSKMCVPCDLRPPQDLAGCVVCICADPSPSTDSIRLRNSASAVSAGAFISNTCFISLFTHYWNLSSQNHCKEEATEHLSFCSISESSECWRNQCTLYQLTFTIRSSNEERDIVITGNVRGPFSHRLQSFP